MNPEVLKRLWEQRLKTVHDLQALATLTEGREPTAEEKAAEERMAGELVELDGKIEKGMNELEREKRSAEAMARYEKLTQGTAPPAPPGEDANAKLADEFRALSAGTAPFVDVALNSRDMARNFERRDLTIGPTANVPVPDNFASQLYEVLLDTSTIRAAGPTVYPTSAGNLLEVPRASAHGGATFMGEGATIPENDPTLDSITLSAFKVGALTEVTSELLQDSGFNIIDYLARHAGENIAIRTDQAYIDGTGTGEPTGIKSAVTVGVTGAGSLATVGFITYDNVVDMLVSVNARYRRQGVWLVHDSALAGLMKLKDANDRPIWLPSTVPGAPDTLLGRPVLTDPNLDPVAINSISLLFGAFRGYAIRDVRTVRFERSDHFRFNSDIVSFRALWQTDGKLLDANAVKSFKTTPTA